MFNNKIKYDAVYGGVQLPHESRCLGHPKSREKNLTLYIFWSTRSGLMTVDNY